MANQGVVRPLKGGGCSICRAAPENVGKKRCHHVLENAAMAAVKHHDGVTTIDISGTVDGKDTKFSIKASEKEVHDYVSSLAKGLTTQQRKDVLAALRRGM